MTENHHYYPDFMNDRNDFIKIWRAYETIKAYRSEKGEWDDEAIFNDDEDTTMS